MEDAISQMLEMGEEASQYGAAKFFQDYFRSVRLGTHILFREYGFIQATPHNRASFLRIFWQCFRPIGRNGDLLTVTEYHSLLQLLCPDFPIDLTHKAARIVLMEDAMDCLMSFSDFLFAFQIQFYYSEFLDSAAAVYHDLLSGKNPNTVIVPTSSSGQSRQRPGPSDTGTQEGVEAPLFLHSLESLCERYKHSRPPPALIKEALGSVQRLTFYGLLMTLSKHPGINKAIGALPDKAHVLVDTSMDQELEILVSHMSVAAPGGTTSLPAREPGHTVPTRRPLHHRRRADLESDGSTEDTDSSEN
ncbi:centriolar satellite-associated tubulin polyglutamylase complex regulator 1 isoform X2 [Ambystoma mexicanum]